MTFKVQTLSFTTNSYLKINKGDITQWFVDRSSDAIPYMRQLDRIFKRLVMKSQKSNLESVAQQEKQELHRGGFKLLVSLVIHTVGPVFNFHCDLEGILRSSYKNCLRVAKANNIQYIACYPPEKAATIAISTVKEFAQDFKEVHFILLTDDIYNIWIQKRKELLQA